VFKPKQTFPNKANREAKYHRGEDDGRKKNKTVAVDPVKADEKRSILLAEAVFFAN